MSIRGLCPNNHELIVEPAHIGRKVRCPACKVVMVVPDPNLGAVAPGPVPPRPGPPPLPQPVPHPVPHPAPAGVVHQGPPMPPPAAAGPPRRRPPTDEVQELEEVPE